MSESSRDAILGRVRAGLGRSAVNHAEARRIAETRLLARTLGPQPRLGDDLAGRFCACAEALASTVERVAAEADVPAAAARYLAGIGIAGPIVAAPDVASLDWVGAGLTVAARGAVDADAVGITGCFCAVAETGTLMLLSGPESPASVSLLPETHIAVVPAARVVPTMEAAFALLRDERGAGGDMPRAVNFVSGPSRTGDIEQTLVLGAHGPCRVHLLVVG